MDLQDSNKYLPAYIRSNAKVQPTHELDEVHLEKTEEVFYNEERFGALYKAIGELPPVDRLDYNDGSGRIALRRDRLHYRY